MSDRYSGVAVTFDRDIRDDDAQDLLRVLRSLKGVLAVEPQVTDFKDFAARSRANIEWRKKILTLLEDSCP